MREDPQEDLLEQVFTQGLEKLKPSSREASEGAAPEAGPAESGSAGKQKSSSSAVYPYLTVMLGAALLVLLLAYFIQQRNSRELKAQNAALEEQAQELRRDLDIWKRISFNWEEKYDAAAQEASDYRRNYYVAQGELFSWKLVWALEQSYQAEEYEDCVAILFLSGMSEYGGYFPNEEAVGRCEEIIQALIKRGLFPEDLEIYDSDFQYYQNLIDAYLAKHPDYTPTSWPGFTDD